MSTTTPPSRSRHLPKRTAAAREAWRRHTEEVILGACLIHPAAFTKVMDVLQPQNFTGSSPWVEIGPGQPMPHGHVWQAIGATYLKGVVDMVTVCQTLVLTYGHIEQFNANDCALALCKLTDHVASSENLRHHAVQLMEMSIREIALDLLRSMAEDGDRFDEFTAITAHVADESKDLFAMIETCVNYLRSYGMNDEAEIMDQMVGDVSRRLNAIRAQQFKNHIITQYNLIHQQSNP